MRVNASPAAATDGPAAQPAARPATDTDTVAVGVLLDGQIQDQWVLQALQLALAVPGVRLAQVVIARSRRKTTLAAVLHRALDGIDRRLRCHAEHLFASVDIAARLATPVLDISVVSDGDSWYPSDQGMNTLRRCNVDVWLCFVATPPRRPLPPVSHFGVWGIEIGEGVSACSPWAGANEVGEGCPATTVSVVDYSNPDGAIVCKACNATVMNSARNNRLHSLRLGQSFFRRLLQRLTGNKTPRNRTPRFAVPVAGPPSRGRSAAPASPTVAAVVRVSWRLLANVAVNRWRLLHSRDQWQIAYHFTDADELDHRQLRYLVPPKDRFWADPFAVEHNGRFFIFFEELEYRRQKGRIVVTEVFEHSDPTEPRVVLDRPYHLSYPFIFNWQGSYYLVPESAANRTVELYRCESFPLRWRLHKVLLEDIEAFDCTLWRHEQRWWMFVTVAAPGTDGNDELHLYSSDTPLGPWVPHGGNPVLSDVRCARPAGPLFVKDGVLYRPSQDSSRAYGHSVQISRVDALDDNDYRQRAVRRISPDWRRDILRVHTWGGTGRLRVIDYLVSRKRWSLQWPERTMVHWRRRRSV